MAHRQLPSAEALRQLLRYDAETGTLFWLRRTPDMFADGHHSASHTCAIWNARWADKPALDHMAPDLGYRVGSIFGKRCFAHRAIVALVTGEWPPQVDHIDGDRGNNRWLNLRPVNTSDQAKNKPLRKDNASGVAGVSWSSKLNAWRVRIGSGGEKHVGIFVNLEDAAAARRAAEIEHNYHPNHGRPA